MISLIIKPTSYFFKLKYNGVIKRYMMSSSGAGKQPVNTPKNPCQLQHNNNPNIKTTLSEDHIPPITESIKKQVGEYHNTETSNEYLYDIAKPKVLGESKTVEKFWAKFDNSNSNMKNHETQHTNFVEKKEDGTSIVSVFATSQKNNPVTNTKNLDFGSPQINNSTKAQRFSTYANPRLLDDSLKKGVHYEKDIKANAYYQGLSETRKAELEALAKKGTISDKPNHLRIFVHRTSTESASKLNDMGYEDEQEYTKTDFHDIINHD